MAWVCLAVRKVELTSAKNQYQMEELSTSREERQVARHYSHEQIMIQNDKSEALRNLRTEYTKKKKSIFDEINNFRKLLSELDSTDESNKSAITSYTTQLNQKQKDLDEEKEEYDEKKDSTQTYFEDEQALIEEEANDIETDYENSKVEIETQLQNITDELETIKSALPNEIKNCTINFGS